MAIPKWKRGIQTVGDQMIYYSSPTVTATAIKPVKTLDMLGVKKGTLVSTPNYDYIGNAKLMSNDKKKTTNTQKDPNTTPQPQLDIGTQGLVAALSALPVFGMFAKMGAGYAANQYEQQTGQPFYTIAPYIAPAAGEGQLVNNTLGGAADAVGGVASGLLPDWKKLAVVAAAVIGGIFLLKRK